MQRLFHRLAHRIHKTHFRLLVQGAEVLMAMGATQAIIHQRPANKQTTMCRPCQGLHHKVTRNHLTQVISLNYSLDNFNVSPPHNIYPTLHTTLVINNQVNPLHIALLKKIFRLILTNISLIRTKNYIIYYSIELLFLPCEKVANKLFSTAKNLYF